MSDLEDSVDRTLALQDEIDCLRAELAAAQAKANEYFADLIVQRMERAAANERAESGERWKRAALAWRDAVDEEEQVVLVCSESGKLAESLTAEAEKEDKP